MAINAWQSKYNGMIKMEYFVVETKHVQLIIVSEITMPRMESIIRILGNGLNPIPHARASESTEIMV